jgi:hypothetical protein
MRLRLLAALLLFTVTACATSEWDRVRSTDSAEEYRRFAQLRPTSPYRDEAMERAAFLDLRANPEWDAFEAFRKKYPHSDYIRRAAILFEEESYERARRVGTAAAYQEFLQSFSNGQRAANARAAVEYLSNDGFASNPQALGDFIRRHPQSEYGVEARRALEMLRVRQGKRFKRIGLRIEIDGAVASPDRVRRSFRQRAEAAYAGNPVQLVSDSSFSAEVDGWITIRHSENPTVTQVTDGKMLPPGVLAVTDLSFRAVTSNDPIFEERFTLRVSDSERRPNTSVLFTPRSELYWTQFFVPMATWPTHLARRGQWQSDAPLQDIDLTGDRAVVLSRNGSFRTLAVSDPAHPAVVAHFRTKRAIVDYDGVRRYSNAIVMFGQDGIRVMAIDGDGNTGEVAAWDRGDVGAVRDLTRIGEDLVLASSRGLLRVPIRGGEATLLINGKLKAVAHSGDRVYLLDDQWLYAAQSDSIRRDAVRGLVRFDRGFGAKAVHVAGPLAAVVGEKEVMCLYVGGSGRAKVMSRLRRDEVGEIHDVALLGGRVFLLGTRGLQVVDPRRGTVLDSIDVDARDRLSATGRLLAASGDRGVELIDATPWMATQSPAAQ